MPQVPPELLHEPIPMAAEPVQERLLIPIGRNTAPFGMIRYAQRRVAMGKQVAACLLHVEEIRGPWELLRSSGTDDMTTRRLIEPLLNKVSRHLTQIGIPNAAYLRSGGVVFAILDIAEELDCTCIVVPIREAGWRRRFSADIVATLCAVRRAIPVITVAPDGTPLRPRLG